MDVKEAVKWIFDIWHEWENVYGVSGEISLKEGKKMDEVIELLKRGEKFEAMWKEFFEMYCGSEVEKDVYVEEVFDHLEQKYFPKEEVDNETKI